MKLACRIDEALKRRLESGEEPVNEIFKDQMFVPLNELPFRTDPQRPWQVLIEPDREHGQWQWHQSGDTLKASQIAAIEPADALHRTCVLLSTSMIDEKWCRPVMRRLIEPSDRVCVLGLSFFDDTKNQSDWNRQYGKGQGIWYRAYTDVFYDYGLKENQIEWISYFEDSVDSMKTKIARSSILFLPGGAPDLFMKRIWEKKLRPLLKHYQGLVIGVSAGAMIQLDTYHISPDEDYPVYSVQKGLGYLNGFDLEVHFRKSRTQLAAIERTLEERRLPVYALYEDGGMAVDENGRKIFFGKTEEFPA